MSAGVPIKKQVAGISCGLVTETRMKDYLVLTAYSGLLKISFGDMDFKVAGTMTVLLLFRWILRSMV